MLSPYTMHSAWCLTGQCGLWLVLWVCQLLQHMDARLKHAYLPLHAAEAREHCALVSREQSSSAGCHHRAEPQPPHKQHDTHNACR